jgi:hypothetical protein
MSELRELQSDFQAYVLGAPNTAATRVVDAGRLSADERLQVYADAYRLRLIEALETDFIALRAFLGEDAFNALARAYIDASPSTHYSLRYFGTGFAGFLARTSPYAATPVLAELAAFDWALTNAFDATDDPVLAVDDLATIAPQNWPTLRFHAHSSVARLDLQWNAPAIWCAADSGDTLPAPERAETSIPWVIWRQDLSTYFRSLDAHEAYALDALKRGDTFAEICEGLCEWIEPEEAAATAAGLMRQWVADGMLSEFSS